MTDRPSRWLLAGNELIHCQTFTQLPTANSLVGKLDSLKDAQFPCLITSGFYTGCKSQHRKGPADSKHELNDVLVTSDSTIRPEVKDGAGEQMIESGEAFISLLKDNQERRFNESSANADSSKMTVTSEVTRVTTDQGQSVEHLPVHPNTEWESYNNDTIQISISTTTRDYQNDEIDHSVKHTIQPCTSPPLLETKSLENVDLLATKRYQKIKTPEIPGGHTRNAIKPSKSDNVQEKISEAYAPKRIHVNAKIEIIKNNFNKRFEQLNTKNIQKILTQTTSSLGPNVAPGEARRTGRPIIKRRTSSTIRKIQETIKEQSKYKKEESCTDIQEQQEEDVSVAVSASSANALAVTAVKNARRQRSKSRTKYSKMKYAQLKRPYRRWLGVSTCIASDTRFIVESDSKILEKKHSGDTLDSLETDAHTDHTLANKCPDSDEKSKVMLEPEYGNVKSPSPGNAHVACQVEESVLLTETCAATETCTATVTGKAAVTSKATETCADTKASMTCKAPVSNENVNKRPVKQLRFEPSPIRNTRGYSEPGLEKLMTPITETVSEAGSKNDEQCKAKSQECSAVSGQRSLEMVEWFIRQDGGLAGKAVSKTTYEFDTVHSSIPVNFIKKPSGKRMLNWELKKYGDPAMLPEKPKERLPITTLRTIKTKFRQTQSKTEYINVQAVKNCEGNLPGQLSYKKGQIIKQLDTGLNAPEGMYYGYYRVGKLRRKVCGIYPSSHVTPVIECSDSDEEKKTSGPNGGGNVEKVEAVRQ